MKNETNDELDEVLGLAVKELTKSPRSKMTDDVVLPVDLNEHVLARLVEAQRGSERAQVVRLANPSSTEIPSRKTSIMFAMFTRFVVAASLLATVVGTVMFGILGGHTSLYAQVAERLEGLQTLICRVQFVDENALVDVDGNNGEKLTYLAPSHCHTRDEWLETTEIFNGETGDYLLLFQDSKQAIVMTGQVGDAVLAESPVRLVEAVRNHFRVNRKDQAGVKDLGTRSVDGKQAIGMRSEIGGEVVEAWFDPESHLPVLVRVRFEIPAHLAGGKKVQLWRVMSDFEFDIPVDRALFSMDVPEGYRQVAMASPLADGSPSTLDDVVKMLRICAQANDSQFPQSLTFNAEEGSPLGIQSRFAAQFEKQFNEADEAKQAALLNAVTEFGVTVARGSVFLLSMEDANRFRYFGGARLNQADRPVLWYSPDGDNRFKIVYADLTVRDADANKLPPEPTPVATVKNELDEHTVDVSTPRFELPRIAVSDYAQLQTIRKAGKQTEVEYLVLGLMPELIESPDSFKAGSPIVPQVVPDGWKPNHSTDSNRLAFLSEFNNLKGLDLSGLYLTQQDLDSVARCQSLKQLSLGGVQIMEAESRWLNGGDLKKLAGLSRLESLDLSQSNFAGGLQNLSSLPQLHTLFLNSFEHLNDRSVAELKELPQLETLILAPVYLDNPETTVTEAGLKSLQQLQALKTLYVGYHGKFTLPVDRLRELLPNVEVKAPLDGVPAR